MKYYIDRASGEVFAYESDGSQDSFINPGLELLDDKGLMQVRAAQETAAAPTPEQVLSSANTQRDLLLAVAALRIAPLQDAVDLGSATDADTVNLKLWKQYRVLINRISEQAGFPTAIVWPPSPA